MAYKPEPKDGKIYVNAKGIRYKVESIKIDGINVLKLKADGTVDKPIFWPESTWNAKNLTLEEEVDGDHDGKKTEGGKSFTFSIDDNGILSITQDGKPIQKLDIRGPEGKPGTNGMPGQNGATGQPGKDGAPGQPGQDGTPGKDGHDGAPGKDGKRGEKGDQGETGPKGEDADLWKPQITPDGQYLFFENQKGEKTEKYPIKGVKGDPGGEGPRGLNGPAGPVFTPNINSDGVLSWSNNGKGLSNPKPISIKGDKGDKGDDGVTYHPVIKDGVLYWHDDKGLVTSISPVKISGKQGDRGDVGPQGLSAYEIWLKQGYRGTEQDFLDSLKGEKGTPAPPANFSFKDVEDFTCKIQKIDTDLIVDSETPTESPEEIIESRIEEIKQLREEGHREDNQKKNRVGWFKKFTWWCAGVDRDLLTMCPSDHAKYVGVGTVILFTALMAWFSSFIAIQSVFDTSVFSINTEKGIKEISVPLIPMFFATFWAAMIFFLDRFITNTMYSDGKVTISKQELICGLPRIVIAIFLGIVISAPLELKIFEDKIDLEIELQYTQERQSEIIRAKDIANKDFNEKLNNKKILLNQYTTSKNDIDGRIGRMNPPETKMGSSGTWIDRRSGQVVGGRERVTNQKEIDDWHKKNDAVLDNLNIRSQEYQSKITALEIDIAEADSLRENAIYEAELKADTLFRENFDRGLSRKISSLHEIAMKGYSPYNGKSNTWLDYVTLHPLWYYLFFSAIGLIMLLFILIDISPVLYKMMLADGKYDNYLHQEKLLAQDKIRLSLSKMLKKLNESELKRVAPFIMGDIYEKMAGDSYVFKTQEEFIEEVKQQKDTGWWWRIWPLSFFRWLFYKEQDRPTAPVIVLDLKEKSRNQKEVDRVNEELFDKVLDMKKRIIKASYERWYKTQHDCIICDDVDDENKGQEPFDDEDIDSEEERVHVDGDESDTTSSYEYTQDTSEDDSEDNTSEDSNDDSEDENPQSEDENSSQNTSDSNDDDEEAPIDEDEHECPEDDGDDNINNKK